MRDIKIRAWDTSDKEKGGYMLGPYDLKDAIFSHNEVRRLSLMQYTGTKDKNGTEIYESDIVKVDEHSVSGGGKWTEQTCVVGFINGAFVIDSAKFHDTIYRMKSHLTVIGNIYQTPELINP